MGELFGQKYDDKEEREPKKPLMSRRTVLRAILGGGAVFATGVTGPSGVDYVEEKVRSEAIKKEILKKLEFLELKYGIPVYGTFFESTGRLANLLKEVDQLTDAEYKEASSVKINRALDYLTQEFTKYPVSFIKNLHIPSVNIVDSLVVDGDQSTMGATSQKNTGMENRIILEISSGVLDKDKNFGWSEQRPFKRTIHHELFHVVFNCAEDSSKHSFSGSWVSIYDPEDFDKSYKDKPGFISLYGQENSTEDFSETASAMMNNSENIFAKVEKDPKLKKKVDFIKQLMFKRSFGLCNQEYWDLLRKGSLSADFFSKRKAYLLSLNLEQFKKELDSNNYKKDIFIGEHNVMLANEEDIFRLFRKNLTENIK